MEYNRSGRQVFGTFIDAIDWPMALDKLSVWAFARESRYVCLCNVHVVMTAWREQEYRRIINVADMATPDGMPIAWVMKKNGFPEQARINGPDLMWRLCGVAERKKIPTFFYGSTHHTLEKLTVNLQNQFPDLEIAGSYSPPFGPMLPEDDQEIIRRINSSGAGIVFVALGCPKQEIWMAQHRGKINAVMLGVGAAFDFHAGIVKRAPKWMQNLGIEWFHRFLHEPRRLWMRYLSTNSLFLWLLIKQYFHQRAKVP